jgi:transposase-like protein
MTKEAMTDKKPGVAKCPACDYIMQRIGRTVFMRVLIGSKRYRCRDCGREYLRFLGHYFPRGL